MERKLLVIFQKVLGTPDPEILAKFKVHGAAHVNFDFPYQKGIGIAQLIPHASPDCVDLMMKVKLQSTFDQYTHKVGLLLVFLKDHADRLLAIHAEL